MCKDAFSNCHPAVCFLFFVGAIGCGVVFQHPAYLIAGTICAALYYLLLTGIKAMRNILLMLPFCAVITAINPLFNTQGTHILFYVFARPYTVEALSYGAALAGIFLVMMLWFGCYNAVMTGDKFTSLFGNLIPAISLLLVMVLRMVPGVIRKTHQILGARRSIGKGAGEQNSYKEKLLGGMTVLSALVSWALEDSIVTADSMRCRGYGSAKRSSFQIYRMTMLDWVILAAVFVLLGFVVAGAILGTVEATYTPDLYIAPLSVTFFAYCTFLLIPTVLHFKEAIQWHISRSRI